MAASVKIIKKVCLRQFESRPALMISIFPKMNEITGSWNTTPISKVKVVKVGI